MTEGKFCRYCAVTGCDCTVFHDTGCARCGGDYDCFSAKACQCEGGFYAGWLQCTGGEKTNVIGPAWVDNTPWDKPKVDPHWADRINDG